MKTLCFSYEDKFCYMHTHTLIHINLESPFQGLHSRMTQEHNNFMKIIMPHYAAITENMKLV